MFTITFIRRDFVHGTIRVHALTTPNVDTAWATFAGLTGVVKPRLWHRGLLIATRASH